MSDFDVLSDREFEGGPLRQQKSLAALAVIVLILAACGSGTETTTTSPGTAETTAGGPSTTGSEPINGIHTSETDLGTILVDGDGFTLYVFTVDTEGVSTCFEGCADVWPPVAAESEIASGLDASIFGSAPRPGEADQLTVGGQPLYRYTPDGEPGATAGQGVNGVWFVVDADGNMIAAPEASSNTGTEPIDDGYDY
jgi:predicted lipoprotein with Yx(FWY)xxD motif